MSEGGGIGGGRVQTQKKSRVPKVGLVLNCALSNWAQVYIYSVLVMSEAGSSCALINVFPLGSF